MKFFKTMPKISIVLPCQNEEKSIGVCIKKIKNALKEKDYEIIVSDSSSDKSAEIAKKLNAKVIKHNKQGYGVAYLEGFKEIKGEYIVMGDADNTYDFLEIPKFITELDKGYDLIIGSRLKGKIKKGAMKPLHRYIGNPLLTWIFNMLFDTKLSDTHSGFRAIKKNKLKKLNLKSPGMEFALEMLIKASKNKLRIQEIPIIYSKRAGESKLNSFRDGIRHLKLMLKEKF